MLNSQGDAKTHTVEQDANKQHVVLNLEVYRSRVLFEESAFAFKPASNVKDLAKANHNENHRLHHGQLHHARLVFLSLCKGQKEAHGTTTEGQLPMTSLSQADSIIGTE